MKLWLSLAFFFALAAPAVCQSTSSQALPQPPSAASIAQATAPPAPPSEQMRDAGQRPPAPGPGTVSGGSAADYNADTTTTIVKTVNEVNLVFTVSDRHGHFIKDLKRDDIKVLDDNKPAAIASFSSQTDLPLRVGLLIDASSSIRDRFRFEQAAAIEFLNQIIRPRSDEAFVLGFDSVSEITQDFTDDTDKLAHGIRILRPGGGTALFDAIYEASKTKLATARAEVPTRRAIILLSDGEDNQSRVTREQAIEMAQRAEVVIYAISTNISGIKTRGDKVLERFSETTGGRVFFPAKLDEVAQAFSQIQDELRSQYALAYKPAEFIADGRFHTIAIESSRKGLRIRSRRGYYAPKQ
jgi:VWFA-related protein